MKKQQYFSNVLQLPLYIFEHFQYEPVEGAKSNKIEGQIAPEIKEERWHRFMQAQSDVSASILAEKIGRTIEVIIDSHDPEDGQAIARSKWDAPEIDGNVFIENGEMLNAGELVKVKVTRCSNSTPLSKLERIWRDLSRRPDWGSPWETACPTYNGRLTVSRPRTVRTAWRRHWSATC